MVMNDAQFNESERGTTYLLHQRTTFSPKTRSFVDQSTKDVKGSYEIVLSTFSKKKRLLARL